MEGSEEICTGSARVQGCSTVGKSVWIVGEGGRDGGGDGSEGEGGLNVEEGEDKGVTVGIDGIGGTDSKTGDFVCKAILSAYEKIVSLNLASLDKIIFPVDVRHLYPL